MGRVAEGIAAAYEEDKRRINSASSTGSFAESLQTMREAQAKEREKQAQVNAKEAMAEKKARKVLKLKSRGAWVRARVVAIFSER